jgi:hypothetical protein
LLAQLRDGETTGYLLDKPQHNKPLQSNRARFGVAVLKLVQLAEQAGRDASPFFHKSKVNLHPMGQAFD